MTALAVVQGTLLILLLAWKAAHLARTPSNVPLRWVVACLAFATAAFAAQLPSASLVSPARSWLVFGQFSLILATSWALNSFFVSALLNAADARRIAVRRAFGLTATAVLMAVATALVPPGASVRDQSVPAVAVVYLLFMAANGTLLADALRHTLRGIAGCGPILARGLRLVSAGFVLMIAALAPLTVVVALRWSRLPAPRILLTAGALVAVLGIVVFLAGVLYPGAVMRLAAVRVHARHYRQYRQLAPLWDELHRAFPQDALARVPSSAWLERITPWGVDRRYYRRVIECRDGLVRVSPRLYAPASTQPLAERLLAALGTVPAAREAPEETVAVAVAVPGSAGLDADASELVSLARQVSALRRRPSAASSAQRDQENT